jgi:glyoxylase-like metal-dependent hydrolase (beta-lactamase superfamily II)
MTTVIQEEKFKIDRYTLGPYGTNCYIVTCLATRESAPHRPVRRRASEIIDYLKGRHQKYILMTHNHEDHTGARKKSGETRVPWLLTRLTPTNSPLCRTYFWKTTMS